MYFSIVPASSIPNIAALSFLTDKMIHALIFLYLSFVGLNCYFNLSKLMLLGMIFAFGLGIEVIHFYHPYRFFEIADLISKVVKGLSENGSNNSKIEKEVQKEVIDLCSSFPIYSN